jgi:hypothetical protein
MCFAKIKTQTLVLKNGKKKVKGTIKATVAADGQSVKLTATAKGTKITFTVDNKSVKSAKGSITVKDSPSRAIVKFKLAGKTRSVAVKFPKLAC